MGALIVAWLKKKFVKYVATPMNNASPAKFAEGRKRIESSKIVSKGGILNPLAAPTKAVLGVGAIFGNTVAAVKPAVNAKGSTSARATAAGVAGSTALFGSTIYEGGKAVKQGVDALPAPVKKAVAPAVGFAAGVVAVPLALRYAPGAVVSTAVKTPIVAGKALSGAGGALVRGDKAGDPDTVPRDVAAPPRSDRKPTGAAAARSGSRSRKVDRKLGRKDRGSGREDRKGDGQQRRRADDGDARRRGSPRNAQAGDGRDPDAGSDRSRGRGRRRRSGGDRLRGLTAAQAQVLRQIEAQGFDVSVSPRR